jgi:23S rRNA (adenine2503-C2)-methyltransferase
MSDIPQVALLGLDSAEVAALVTSMGELGYRAQQLTDAIYRQRLESIEEITTLPQLLRASLKERHVVVGMPRIDKKFVSADGTVRYLVGFADGQTVETVWMPEGDGGEAGDGSEAGDAAELTRRSWDRATICVSSQVGCAVDCQFCLTAQLGVKRNLTAGEIVGQVCAVLKDQRVCPPQDRINLVFMGMGEPFLNYDNFMKAVLLLVQEVGVAESRMTVSTAGIVPRIHDFGQEPIRNLPECIERCPAGKAHASESEVGFGETARCSSRISVA